VSEIVIPIQTSNDIHIHLFVCSLILIGPPAQTVIPQRISGRCSAPDPLAGGAKALPKPPAKYLSLNPALPLGELKRPLPNVLAYCFAAGEREGKERKERRDGKRRAGKGAEGRKGNGGGVVREEIGDECYFQLFFRPRMYKMRHIVTSVMKNDTAADCTERRRVFVRQYIRSLWYGQALLSVLPRKAWNAILWRISS